MEIDRARPIAERLHAEDCEEDGTPLLGHIRRVVLLATAPRSLRILTLGSHRLMKSVIRH